MKLPLRNQPPALARAAVTDDGSPPRAFPLWSPWREGLNAEAPALAEIAQLFQSRLHAHGLMKPMRPEAVIFVVGFAASFVVATSIAEAWNLHWLARSVLVIPGCAATYAAAQAVSLRQGRLEIRARLLASGHCASCGYALGEVPAGGDGLTVCPECGAAWRLPGASANPAPLIADALTPDF